MNEIKEAFCIECGSNSIKKITTSEIVDVRGDKLTVDVSYWKCLECESEWENLNECNDLEKAYRIYRNNHCMLQPEQIKELRKRYGLTQVELSRLLKLGEVTITRYEKGALQDFAHDYLLKFLDDPKNLYRLLKENPNAVSKEKYNKLIKLIKDLLEKEKLQEPKELKELDEWLLNVQKGMETVY